MRDQAINNRRKGRRRPVRESSSIAIRRRSRTSLRWVLRVFPVLVYLSVLILAAWLLYYSFDSPYFAIRDVVVSGNKYTDAVQAQEATASLGRNSLLLRADDIEQSVRSISTVRDAQVVFVLPGELRIEVAERTPVAQWHSGESAFLVDREGVVFSRASPPSRVAIVKDLDGAVTKLGSRVEPGILAAIETLELALPEQAGIRPQWFDYSRNDGIVVPVPGGLRVIFGDASDLEAKLATLAAIRQHLEATKSRADAIDLRFKGRPVYVLTAPAPEKPARTP